MRSQSLQTGVSCLRRRPFDVCSEAQAVGARRCKTRSTRLSDTCHERGSSALRAYLPRPITCCLNSDSSDLTDETDFRCLFSSRFPDCELITTATHNYNPLNLSSDKCVISGSSAARYSGQQRRLCNSLCAPCRTSAGSGRCCCRCTRCDRCCRSESCARSADFCTSTAM